jgi:hypothetical protein
MILLKKLCLAVWLLSFSTAAARADDPRVTALMDVFSHACLSTQANSGLVRAWAAGQKLPEITSPQGRAIFIGNGGGDAWLLRVAGTDAVLSTRTAYGSSGSCIIYGTAADPAEFLKRYEQLLSLDTQHGARVTMQFNSDKPGAYGDRIGKLAFIQPANPAIPPQILALITNQRTGGAYQVSMWYSVYGESGR